MSDASIHRVRLPEHEANPFIMALPPPKSLQERYDSLAQRPDFSPADRDYKHHLRRYCVLRLRHYMEPLMPQLDLAERLEMVITAGYEGRNPNTLAYRRGLLVSAEKLATSQAANAQPRAFQVDQSLSMIGFSVLGCPGMGKTATVERVIASYPPLVEHTLGDSITQIPCLKIECPSLGSRKSFCLAFFKALDDRLGTKHFDRFTRKNISADTMVLHVQHLSYLYALGVLVVDEVQNLRRSPEGPQAVLNFLVVMSNAIKVPVVLVGTMAALDILQNNLTGARRASGVGNQLWDRLTRGVDWETFITDMWSYQWTKVETPLNDEIVEALYDESQGVVDIVIKLFMFAQLRIITLAEVDERKSEVMTAELIRKVAAEDLRIVKPMIVALRNDDRAAIAQFDDLTSLNQHLEDTILTVTNQPAAVIRRRLDVADAARAAAEAREQADTAVLSILKVFKMTATAEQKVLAEVRKRHPSGDLPTLCEAATELALAGDAKLARPKPPARVPRDGDLRELLGSAKKVGVSGYEAFRTAGVVKGPLADLAA